MNSSANLQYFSSRYLIYLKPHKRKINVSASERAAKNSPFNSDRVLLRVGEYRRYFEDIQPRWLVFLLEDSLEN
jgi:hypothetical protein